MPAHRVVVVGAVAAGAAAAHQALRTARSLGRDLEVVMLDRGRDTSYSACGIPYWLAGDVASDDALVARSADQHRALGVDLRLGTTVTRLDLDARRVHVDAGPPLPFDDLLLTTGARPRVPAWARRDDGSLVPGVRPVWSLEDGRAWLADLGAQGETPRRAVVVGGGYIGVEMAEVLLRRGLQVVLVTRREVMATLEPVMGQRIRSVIAAAGVEVVCGAEVDGLEVGADGRVGCVHAAGTAVPADVVVLAAGAEPQTALAREAGLPVGRYGGLLPDARQQVADGVWAAGDCVESVARLGGARVYVPLGTHASKQGRVAGENIAGGSAAFGGVLGTAVTRFAVGSHVVEVGRTGPSCEQARAASAYTGWDVVDLVTESTTASGYMPEASPVAVLVLADRASRALLGVQVVGGPGSAKRIDTAAMALWHGATVDDVAAADLSYVPPLSPTWDPVQIACRRLAERL